MSEPNKRSMRKSDFERQVFLASHPDKSYYITEAEDETSVSDMVSKYGGMWELSDKNLASHPQQMELLYDGWFLNSSSTKPTIPNLQKYRHFLILMGSTQTGTQYGLNAVASDFVSSGLFTYILGVNAYHSTSQMVRDVILNVNGNTIQQYTAATSPAGAQTHTASGSHGALTQYGVTKIYGFTPIDPNTKIKVFKRIVNQRIDNFDDWTWKNTTPVIDLTGGVDNTAMVTITGRASRSSGSADYESVLRGYKKYNFDNIKAIKFKAKKILNHGNIMCWITTTDNFTNGVTYADKDIKIDLWYSTTETNVWEDYELDVTSIKGENYLNFPGGYTDRSGSTSSSTAYCDIELVYE